jgi:CRP/FNR family transcriptional regulator, cyclic AMP receptor protein
MPVPRTEPIRRFLREIPVFGGLEGRWLESVLGVLNEMSFPVRSAIVQEGELGRTMHVLVSGEVEVRRRSSGGKDVPIVRLSPGECFGEMALVELEPRSATVVALKKVKTYALTNLDLYKLFQQDQYAYIIVLQNICRLLSRRLRKADGRICEFLADTPRARRR